MFLLEAALWRETIKLWGVILLAIFTPKRHIYASSALAFNPINLSYLAE